MIILLARGVSGQPEQFALRKLLRQILQTLLKQIKFTSHKVRIEDF